MCQDSTGGGEPGESGIEPDVTATVAGWVGYLGMSMPRMYSDLQMLSPDQTPRPSCERAKRTGRTVVVVSTLGSTTVARPSTMT